MKKYILHIRFFSLKNPPYDRFKVLKINFSLLKEIPFIVVKNMHQKFCFFLISSNFFLDFIGGFGELFIKSHCLSG